MIWTICTTACFGLRGFLRERARRPPVNSWMLHHLSTRPSGPFHGPRDGSSTWIRTPKTIRPPRPLWRTPTPHLGLGFLCTPPRLPMGAQEVEFDADSDADSDAESPILCAVCVPEPPRIPASDEAPLDYDALLERVLSFLPSGSTAPDSTSSGTSFAIHAFLRFLRHL